jgi:translation elongation factor EF-1alpha
VELLEVRLTTSFDGLHLAIASERTSEFCVAGDVVTVGIHGIEQTALRCVLLSLCPVTKTVRAGDVVCHIDSPIAICAIFFARVITFEAARPIVQGSSVCLPHTVTDTLPRSSCYEDGSMNQHQSSKSYP